MEHGRNNGDEQEPVDRLARHVMGSEERVVRDHEEGEGAEVEIVPVEAGRARALLASRAALDVRPEKVAEERADREDDDREQPSRKRSPREVWIDRRRGPLYQPREDSREHTAD